METDNVMTGRIHHGRNVKRLRREKGMKQELLADLVSLSQQTISRYEAMKVIDDEMLERFAKALGVAVDDIKSMEEDSDINIFIENHNRFENSDGVSFSSSGIEQKCVNTNAPVFNPLDKVSELYERIIQEKEDRIAMLNKRMEELEEKLRGF